MYEILMLPIQGNPETDWCVFTTRYVKRGNARKTMYKFLHSGLYQAVILRDEKLQDRAELIASMNKYLASEYHRESENQIRKMNGGN